MPANNRWRFFQCGAIEVLPLAILALFGLTTLLVIGAVQQSQELRSRSQVYPCGGQNQSCCSGNSCNAGLSCASLPGGYFCITPTCTEGAKRCSDEYLQQCQSGQFVNIARCDGGCNSGVSPPVCNLACSPNQMRCADSNTLETCAADGSGWAKRSCSDGCGEVNGTAQCKTAPPPPPPPPSSPSSNCGGQSQACCSGGSCGTGLLCTAQSGGYYCLAPACTEGRQQCSGNYLQTCQNGQFINTTRCDGGCDGSKSPPVCYSFCPPGYTRCTDDSTAVETCAADGSGWARRSCSYGCKEVNGTTQCQLPLPTPPSLEPPLISFTLSTICDGPEDCQTGEICVSSQYGSACIKEDTACGQAGSKCCSNDTCNSDLACVQNMCVGGCGGVGALPCTGSRCREGLVLNEARDRCITPVRTVQETDDRTVTYECTDGVNLKTTTTTRGLYGGSASSDTVGKCEWHCDTNQDKCVGPTPEEAQRYRYSLLANAIDREVLSCSAAETRRLDSLDLFQRTRETSENKCTPRDVYPQAVQNLEPDELSPTIKQLFNNTNQYNIPQDVYDGMVKAETEKRIKSMGFTLNEQTRTYTGMYGPVLSQEQLDAIRNAAKQRVDQTLSQGALNPGGVDQLTAGSGVYDTIAQRSLGEIVTITTKDTPYVFEKLFNAAVATGIWVSSQGETGQEAFSSYICGSEVMGNEFGDQFSPCYQQKKVTEAIAKCDIKSWQRDFTPEQEACLKGESIAVKANIDTLQERRVENAALQITTGALATVTGGVGGALFKGATTLVRTTATVAPQIGVDLAFTPVYAELFSRDEQQRADMYKLLSASGTISEAEKTTYTRLASSAQAEADESYRAEMVSGFISAVGANIGFEALTPLGKRIFGESRLGSLFFGKAEGTITRETVGELVDGVNARIMVDESRLLETTGRIADPRVEFSGSEVNFLVPGREMRSIDGASAWVVLTNPPEGTLVERVVDGRSAYYLANSRGQVVEMELKNIDPVTRTVRPVASETTQTIPPTFAEPTVTKNILDAADGRVVTTEDVVEVIENEPIPIPDDSLLGRSRVVVERAQENVVENVRRLPCITLGPKPAFAQGGATGDPCAQAIGQLTNAVRDRLGANDVKVTIGRSSGNTVNTGLNQTVSRNHATVAIDENGTLLVTDANSANGTFVNDARIPTNTPVAVKSGDAVTLGSAVTADPVRWRVTDKGVVGALGPEEATHFAITPDENLVTFTTIDGHRHLIIIDQVQKKAPGTVELAIDNRAVTVTNFQTVELTGGTKVDVMVLPDRVLIAPHREVAPEVAMETPLLTVLPADQVADQPRTGFISQVSDAINKISQTSPIQASLNRIRAIRNAYNQPHPDIHRLPIETVIPPDTISVKRGSNAYIENDLGVFSLGHPNKVEVQQPDGSWLEIIPPEASITVKIGEKLRINGQETVIVEPTKVYVAKNATPVTLDNGRLIYQNQKLLLSDGTVIDPLKDRVEIFDEVGAEFLPFFQRLVDAERVRVGTRLRVNGREVLVDRGSSVFSDEKLLQQFLSASAKPAPLLDRVQSALKVLTGVETTGPSGRYAQAAESQLNDVKTAFTQKYSNEVLVSYETRVDKVIAFAKLSLDEQQKRAFTQEALDWQLIDLLEPINPLGERLITDPVSGLKYPASQKAHDLELLYLLEHPELMAKRAGVPLDQVQRIERRAKETVAEMIREKLLAAYTASPVSTEVDTLISIAQRGPLVVVTGQDITNMGRKGFFGLAQSPAKVAIVNADRIKSAGDSALSTTIHEIWHLVRLRDQRLGIPTHYDRLPIHIARGIEEGFTTLAQVEGSVKVGMFSSVEEALKKDSSLLYKEAAVRLQNKLKPELAARVGEDEAVRLWEQAMLGDLNQVAEVFGGWDGLRYFLESPDIFGAGIKIISNMSVKEAGGTVRPLVPGELVSRDATLVYPLRTRETYSLNVQGLEIWQRGTWVPVKEGEPIRLEVGDLLRLNVLNVDADFVPAFLSVTPL